MNDSLVALFISSFVTLFVVLDPPGCVPIFSSLTNGASREHRRSMAFRSTAIASGVLSGFISIYYAAGYGVVYRALREAEPARL